MSGSICTLEHKCAVCGQVALYAQHGTRGRSFKEEQEHETLNCPENFLVRCDPCRREGKRPAGKRLASEMCSAPTEEILKWREATDIVYEVM
jgi:predicted RNA-binding Zn-ribbon protein involved in translation (DUF1610 family)